MDFGENAHRAINNARALLEAMVAGGWEQVCITGPEGDYFLARDAGTANPLLSPGEAPVQPVVESTPLAVSAPHVGTVTWLTPVGQTVAEGAVVARLAVLDEEIEVLAASAGTVADHCVKIDDLAQFGTPLLVLAI